MNSFRSTIAGHMWVHACGDITKEIEGSVFIEQRYDVMRCIVSTAFTTQEYMYNNTHVHRQ